MLHRHKKMTILAAVILVALIIAAICAGVAFAASWHVISASCPANDSWRIGDNTHTVTGSGGQSLKFWASYLCTGGLTMRCIRADTHAVFGSAKTWTSLNTTQTMATSVIPGTNFNYQFHENGSGSNHGWGGQGTW